MFERVQLPDARALYRAYPHQLSGGQRQRVMIAMALILEPSLLIADEPTTALDVTTQAEILKLIRGLQQQSNTAVLFITHDFGVVSEVADSIAVLERGKLVESGPAGEILTRPRHPYTRRLLAAVPGLTPRKATTAANVGLEAHRQLVTSGLTKVFESGGWFRQGRRVTAVDAVDLHVRRGETLAIVGESGSGKSTVARLLAQLIAPSRGEIDFDGQDVTKLRGAAAQGFRRKVQVVFQDPFRSLNPRRTVGAAIEEGPLNFGASKVAAGRRAAELMRLVDLLPSALARYPHEFSGGQRQRICIARALALEPEVLVADEAVSALDASVQAQILALLEEIQKRLKLTLIFITHDLRVAAQIAHHVAVMRRGRVIEDGPVGQVFREPKHEYTRALLEAVPGRGVRFGAPGS
jgi:peptide/nickel transport system ATP-binding protein